MRKSEFCATILDNPYIPHEPTVKQAEFLINQSIEGLFGGSAGGGKSDSLLMAGLQYVEHDNYTALLLRRTYADLALPGALMDRAEQWLRPTDAHLDAETKTWEFPSGATVTFGYLQHENDKYRYQGTAFDFVGFDELTQFTQTQYQYLFSRLRRLDASEIPPRMRAASNPGGVGHDWVKESFIDPSYMTMREVGKYFVPAKLADNPYIDQEAYRFALSKLDPVTRAQLEDGDWDIGFEGEMFKWPWFVRQMGKLHDFKVRKVRFWDLAATAKSEKNPDPDHTAGVLLGRDGNRAYVLDVIDECIPEHAVEDLIVDTAKSDGLDVPIVIEQEGGAAAKILINYFKKRHPVLQKYRIIESKPDTNKVVRAKYFSGAVGRKEVIILENSWTRKFLSQLVRFPSPEVHDDMVDAVSGAYNWLWGITPMKAGSVVMGAPLKSGGLTSGSVPISGGFG